MRVLMITPDYPPHYTGGCAFSCQLLVDGLRAQGIHTDVWAFNGDLANEPSDNGMGETRYFPGSKTLLGLNRLTHRELFRREPDHDIIHVYNTQQLPAVVHYTKHHRSKAVATLNNLAPICTNPSEYVEDECSTCGPWSSLFCSLRRQGPLSMRLFMPIHWGEFILLHRLSREADGYIALSESTHNCYVDAGYDPGRMWIIPNMYDPDLKVHTWTKRNDGNKVILYVGRLEVEKGLQVLIKAFSLLGGNSVLYIVGKGDYQSQLIQLAFELGLEGQVIFTGFMDKGEIGRYYEMADLFVSPALWPEPFPRTILEALAYSLPILVSDSGSSAKILGEACLSFVKGDAKDLAGKIDLVLNDESIRKSITVSGWSVLQQYHPDIVIAKVLEIYGELLS